ncbi:MAG: preprotein translocase subunit SecA [Proteobacteria bacterium]|nr:preprotein translocase subunit SecA [Pseudomonadota bacterium]
MFESLSQLALKLFGDANQREIKKIQPLVDRINQLEAEYEALSDEQVQAKTPEFRARLEKGESLDDILPEAFATVREAAKRTLGMRHYDCQLVGGIVIHQGKISEMKTGEGKTLVATGPVYLNALAGNGVHVITVNDYLAARDAEWMGIVYNFLGMTVGKVLSGQRDKTAKRAAYKADITYGTNNEFGFDYLRDNMEFSLENYVQRGHAFAIVDEVDSILIDEARTPLIISGPADVGVELYQVVDAVIPLLQDEVDFTVDEKSRSATLTDAGVHRVEEKLGVGNLFDPDNMTVLHHVNQSLKAHHLFKRDKDYVVRDQKVIIVDEFTGRLMAGRRWSDGLHQAVEAKERVRVEAESQVYATITFQNYYRLYEKLSGMTGTAATEAAEFASIYDLDTLVIPTNRPIARDDRDDIVYKTQMEKFRAVIVDIREANGKGQPVLVGTTSVEKSEIVARLLTRAGVGHEILNAKNHAREAHIIAQAGRLGSVTISTNMAGRGTDIKLGGNPEDMALQDFPDAESAEYAAALEKYTVQCADEQLRVKEAGGLHVIGTERHESRRVDNQLRGRSGRQGDPGSSRFYLALEDDLLRIFSTDKVSVWMERMGLQDDEPIEHRWITSAIENAQKKVEGHHFNIRKNILEYDDVMNYQRKGVYELRRRALAGEGVREMVIEAIENTTTDMMDEFAMEGVHPEQWRVGKLRTRLEKLYAIVWEETDDQVRDYSREELRQRILDEASAKLDERVELYTPDLFDTAARELLLRRTDALWKDHLLAIERLRQGVGLRGYGQRNPLLEYKREAFHMFLMMSAMRDESVLEGLLKDGPTIQAAPAPKTSGGLLDAPPEVLDDAELPPLPSAAPAQPQAPKQVARPEKGAATRAFAEEYGVSRNDPCPCGSGAKFKKCCGSKASLASA